jgi:hypothetical protein
MKKNDFPSYYQASDDASIKAQRLFLITIIIDLMSMIFASLLVIYNYQTSESKFYVYVISGILLLVSLALSIVLKSKKYEEAWYQGRALAESCKTLTWRFVCCSEYFENNLDITEVKKRFNSRIKELSAEFKNLTKDLNSKTLNLPIITNKMLEIRSCDLSARLEYYIQNRIEEQKSWYSDKAEFNSKKYELWFWVIILCQFIALLSVIYLIKVPSSNWNFVSLFTTISASAISWLQLKKHQELKQAYTTATQELNFIITLTEEVVNEDSFSKFVLDSENAISREHILWLAQRRR